jgi:acetoin utilization deacetylase AcuC-like enzyme
MRAFYCDHLSFPLPAGHRFPLAKYPLLREALLISGVVLPANLLVPPPVTDEQLLHVHNRQYVHRLQNGQLTAGELRRIGLPWSRDLVQRARCAAGGTVAACRAALQDGIAVNLGGGTHHAFHDHGQGFCLFNDIVIAARTMQAEGRVQRVVVLDCDVHQGNGTAALAAGDPTIFTFSIHNEDNFPLRKEHSDLDIGLGDGTGDEAYLQALEQGLQQALRRAGADLAIYLAGADPYVGDLLGRFALSKDGLAQRDRTVLRHCQASGLPVAVLMAGGYARDMQDIVDINLQTARIAAEAEASLGAACHTR